MYFLLNFGRSRWLFHLRTDGPAVVVLLDAANVSIRSCAFVRMSIDLRNATECPHSPSIRARWIRSIPVEMVRQKS